jgi:hypothetical protein
VGNAQVSVSEIVDIDSDDNTVIERRKNYKGDVNEALYGIPCETKEEAKQEEAKTEPNSEGLKLKLYEILKEKKIDTLTKVKEILKSVFPDENWANIKKDVFEKMPEEKISKVIEHLK